MRNVKDVFFASAFLCNMLPDWEKRRKTCGGDHIQFIQHLLTLHDKHCPHYCIQHLLTDESQQLLGNALLDNQYQTQGSVRNDSRIDNHHDRAYTKLPIRSSYVLLEHIGLDIGKHSNNHANTHSEKTVNNIANDPVDNNRHIYGNSATTSSIETVPTLHMEVDDTTSILPMQDPMDSSQIERKPVLDDHYESIPNIYSLMGESSPSHNEEMRENFNDITKSETNVDCAKVNPTKNKLDERCSDNDAETEDDFDAASNSDVGTDDTDIYTLSIVTDDNQIRQTPDLANTNTDGDKIIIKFAKKHLKDGSGRKSQTKKKRAHAASVEYKQQWGRTRQNICLKCGSEFAIRDDFELHMQTHKDAEPFICLDCGSEFSEYSALDTHSQTHGGKKTYTCCKCKRKCLLRKHFLNYHVRGWRGGRAIKQNCPICGEEFSTRINLCEHQMLVHNVTKPFACTNCDKSFITINGLKRHKLIHTGNVPFPCAECSRGLKSKTELKLHMMMHNNEKPFVCQYCSKSFVQLHRLNQHIRTHTLEKPHLCTVCGKGFSLAAQLTAHMYQHSGQKPHACEICSKRFVHLCHLKSHMVYHRDERAHPCTECDARFKTKRLLIRHMQIHSGLKAFRCSVCNKGFVLKEYIKAHMLTHTGVKAFGCDECGKKFKSSDYLKIHKNLHTGEKSFECHECKQQFTQSGSLKRHMRIHAGTNPYKCDLCYRTFNQLDSLKRHTLTHTGQKPHVCVECGEQFRQSGGLKSHMKKHMHELKKEK